MAIMPEITDDGRQVMASDMKIQTLANRWVKAQESF